MVALDLSSSARILLLFSIFAIILSISDAIVPESVIWDLEAVEDVPPKPIKAPDEVVLVVVKTPDDIDPTPEVTCNMRLVVMKTVEYEEVTWDIRLLVMK